jgi:thiol-disulfide isomerase/thioredoxin
MVDMMHDCSRRRLIGFGLGMAMAGMEPLKTAMAEGESGYGIRGSLAPELELDYWIDSEGKPTTYSIAAERGKWVFLKCFQDWCPGCHSSGFPTLQKFSAAFAGHPQVSIVGVQTVFEGFASNTLADVRKLQLQYQLPITMGHDAGDPKGDHRPQTMRKYRTGGTPWIVIIAPDGQVVFNDYHINVAALIEYIQQQVG